MVSAYDEEGTVPGAVLQRMERSCEKGLEVFTHANIEEEFLRWWIAELSLESRWFAKEKTE